MHDAGEKSFAQQRFGSYRAIRGNVNSPARLAARVFASFIRLVSVMRAVSSCSKVELTKKAYFAWAVSPTKINAVGIC